MHIVAKTFEFYFLAKISSVCPFILDFVSRYSKVNAQKMTFLDPVLACQLLHCCILGDNQRNIVLSETTDFDFDKMKSTLRCNMKSTIPNKTFSKGPELKDEPVFLGKSESKRDEENEESAFYTKGARGKCRARFRSDTSKLYPNRKDISQGKNPIDRSGKISP